MAPRGWHCIGIVGSDGVRVIVTPQRRRAADFIGSVQPLRGPAVEISHEYGGTSGRFAVAGAIARYFPGHISFVREVERSGLVDEPFAAAPSSADRIERISDREIRFVTPAGASGEGTRGLFAADGGAVAGAVALRPGVEPDLVTIRVRLPAEARAGSVDFIIAESLLWAGRGR